MCGWSAEDADSRPAVVGDKLVTDKINTHVTGLVARSNGETVCLLTGSKIQLINMPVIAGRPDVPVGTFEACLGEHQYTGGEEGPTDILDCGNGAKIFLTYIPLGVNVTVLSIPAIAAAEPIGIVAVERQLEVVD